MRQDRPSASIDKTTRETDRNRIGRRRLAPGRSVRYHWMRLLRLRADPRTIARGVAIGVFFGFTPTIPFHSSLILVFCALFAGNPLAGLASSIIVSNPLTIPLHYYGAWKIGTLITQTEFSWEAVKALLKAVEASGLVRGIEVLTGAAAPLFATLLVGGVVLATPFAVAGYLLAFRMYSSYERRRLERALRRKAGMP